jgi:putative transcriptional regulator
MSNSAIQNSIRKYRFLAGELTQQELADQLNVSRQTIVAIEKGNYSPSLELAFKIATVFNCAIEDVFTYHPPQAKAKKRNQDK